ncbi:MAG TPA: terminase small subunit [Candidatus Sulfotelmatobacter sp.]|nr:terminase small subunit [Candidatus Sulfotelmatobacter sp.]
MAKPLSPKRRAFVRAFVTNGRNGTKAAIAAGYAKGHSARTQGARLLADEGVRAALAEYEHRADDKTILTVAQLQQVWSRKTAQSPDERIQLKASELLGKSLGAFVDRVEHSLSKSLEELVRESYAASKAKEAA